MEVLTGDGRIVACTADNEHRDLFHGFPNSYGTLGYALKLTARTIPVERYVRVDHARHTDAGAFFAALAQRVRRRQRRFRRRRGVRPQRPGADAAGASSTKRRTSATTRSSASTIGRCARKRSITSRRATTCGAGTPTGSGARRTSARSIRWCDGCSAARRLNSITYQKIMRWNARWHVTGTLDRLRGVHSESVIQDVDIPARARRRNSSTSCTREVGILPIWICPIRAPDAARRRRSIRCRAARCRSTSASGIRSCRASPHAARLRQPQDRAQGDRPRRHQVALLRLVLHEDEFWSIYNRPAYSALKARYDSEGALGDLYANACCDSDRVINRHSPAPHGR